MYFPLSAVQALNPHVYSHRDGYRYLYPVPTIAQYRTASGHTGTGEVLQRIRQQWQAVHTQAQFGFCLEHHDAENVPILVLREIRPRMGWRHRSWQQVAAVIVCPAGEH